MIRALINMKGTLSRVFVAYPMALPFSMMALAYFFPEYLAYDEEARRVTFTATIDEIGAAAAGAYGLIAVVFAKWGIKK